MDISPDQDIFWQWGFVKLNATILFTWGLMILMVIGARIGTRGLTSDRTVGRWQNILEAVVGTMRKEIRDLSGQDPKPFLPFIGTLFLFIALSNALDVVPWFQAPTGSLSTTAALAVCVFVAVPLYGIANSGVRGYLKHYIEPTPFMLPFHIMGELSRTLALAVRLFGNVMSGARIVAILLVVVPFIFPVVMKALSLLVGLIHAYIFAVLAMVYIASGMRSHADQQAKAREKAEQAGGKQAGSRAEGSVNEGYPADEMHERPQSNETKG